MRSALKRVAQVCLCLMLLPVQMAAAHADDGATLGRAIQEAVTVSVPLRTIDTPDRTGQNGILSVQVGKSDPISVMLDTGSVGLRLWGGRPAGALISKTKISSQIGGSSMPGLLGKASMSLGGVTTTLDVPFQLINSDSSYIKQWKSLGVSGILGIGTGSGALTNPLVALPGSLGVHWSVHFGRSGSRGALPGALVLGAPAPTSAVMHFQLPSLGQNPNGALLWDDHSADGCWAFGSGAEQCVPTWLDSGFTVMRVKGRQFSSLPVNSSHRLASGTSVSLSAGSSAFVGHRFVAGSTGSSNLVTVLPDGRAGINTGNSLYFDYTVTYDVGTGGIWLTDARPKKKGPAGNG